MQLERLISKTVKEVRISKIVFDDGSELTAPNGLMQARSQDEKEMLESLSNAIVAAGGHPISDFSDMTYQEFIEHLAPNKIRFVYTGERCS